MLFADLPRIRLDKVNRTKVLQFWEAPPTLQEEPEDGDETNNASSYSGENIQLNMTLQNMQGKSVDLMHDERECDNNTINIAFHILTLPTRNTVRHGI